MNGISLRRLAAYALLYSFTVVAVCADGTAIVKTDDEYTVTLSDAMQSALKRYDRSFVIRKQSEYLPSLLQDYSFSAQQTPFAVIGDFNGDNKADLALMGHTAKHDVLIAILSRGKRYTIVEVVRGPLTDPRTERYDDEYGLWQYLAHASPGKITSSHEDRPLELKTDALYLHYYDKASELLYYKRGKFRLYLVAD